jgi:hypothetical protein
LTITIFFLLVFFFPFFLFLFQTKPAVGCLSVGGHQPPRENGGRAAADKLLLPQNVRYRMPAGLEVCATPESLQTRSWYSEDNHGTHRGAVISLVVFQRFPGRKWYVVGDDDTLFSPLALAQWLQNFDSSDPWYLGGRSEDVAQRRRLGWDMAFGGGGIVLSGGLMNAYASTLERCFDQAPWNVAPGGDWLLHRCLVHLGVPLTPAPGMHQLDVNAAEYGHEKRLLDIVERHPVSPFLSIHHPSRVFGTASSPVKPGPFFEGMHHDPSAFLQLVLCEVRSSTSGGGGTAPGFTAAVVAGLSVRLWRAVGGGGPGKPAAALLWDQTRTDVLSPAVEDVSLYGPNTVEARYVFSRARESGAGALRTLQGLATVSVYELASLHGGGGSSPMAKPPITSKPGAPGSGRGGAAAAAPYALVLVVEERQRNRWVGAPLKFCHAGSYELEFELGPPVSSEKGTVLMLATRDCHIPAAKAMRMPSREEIGALLRVVLGPRAGGLGPIPINSRELPRSPSRPYL